MTKLVADDFVGIEAEDTKMKAYMEKQPDADAIFEKHAELSMKPAVSGWQGSLHFFNGKNWKFYGTIAADAWAWLQKAMNEHGTKVSGIMWEFPEDFVFECFSEAQNLKDLGY